MELVKLRQECTHLVLADIIMRKSTFHSRRALMIPQFQDLELMNIKLIQFNTMMDANLISKVELRILLVSIQTIYNLIYLYRTITYQH
jgi:hypothetical protein